MEYLNHRGSYKDTFFRILYYLELRDKGLEYLFFEESKNRVLLIEQVSVSLVNHVGEGWE